MSIAVLAQVTGGQFAFEYLRLPSSPYATAMGGMCPTATAQDVSLAVQNPALMRPGLHNRLSMGYNSYYAGIGISNIAYGYHVPSLKTSFLAAMQYVNYGNFTQTDIYGNEYGSFKGADYMLSLTASRQYLTKWTYGASLKYARSSLQPYEAIALLADVGIHYYDTTSLISIGAVAKNLGGIIKNYSNTTPAEAVPFDLQIGISKRLKHTPLRLFATFHHLYEWDIRYDNPADNVSSGILGATDTTASTKKYTVNKFFRHCIFGAEVALGKHILVTTSYNTLRRQELALKAKPGATGFAFGVTLLFNKLDLHYGRSIYHVAGAYNEFSLSVPLQKMISINGGKMASLWNAEYPNW
ncbi:MAG: hypothetical protein EBX41_02805 [Chitinophagia bacterium]|nr:hypothetical protein [Chitinophagia bacterium]